jgi:GNAT superfamily N-acetyltransferase
MAELGFRPAEDRHVAGIVGLWQRCGLASAPDAPLRHIAAARGGGGSTVLVGLIEDEPVAAILVEHDGGCGAFYYVAVAPEHRRCGYGSAAIRAGEAWLKEHGVRNVNILLRDRNDSVKAFYERLGFAIDPGLSMGSRLISANHERGAGHDRSRQ